MGCAGFLLQQLPEGQDVPERILDTDLDHPPGPLDRLVEEIGAALLELPVELGDVVREEVDVEQVGLDDLAVRSPRSPDGRVAVGLG